jgi:hypothetical protein
MTGISVEKMLAGGCSHAVGMVALSVGKAVCMACFRDLMNEAMPGAAAEKDRADNAERANARLRDDLDLARGERDRLAGDALAALSSAGIPTPVEGYVAAPHLLKADIARLASSRPTGWVHNDDDSIALKAARKRVDEVLAVNEALRGELASAKIEEGLAQAIKDKERFLAERNQYRDDAMKAEKNQEAVMARFQLAIEIMKALGGIQ